jgi:hypothetical protein
VPIRDASVDIAITTPDGRLLALHSAPDPDASVQGRYVARFTPDQPGIYRVKADATAGTTSLGSTSTSMLVGGADAEMADPRLNEAVLQRIAAASGGRMVPSDQIGSLVTALQAGVPSAALSVRRDLWHNAWSLVALIALLAGEWIVRRRWGLR